MCRYIPSARHPSFCGLDVDAEVDWDVRERSFEDVEGAEERVCMTLGRPLEQGASPVQPAFCQLQPHNFCEKDIPIQNCVEKSSARKCQVKAINKM